MSNKEIIAYCKEQIKRNDGLSEILIDDTSICTENAVYQKIIRLLEDK